MDSYQLLSAKISAALEDGLSGHAGERLLAGRTRRLIEGERRSVAVLFLDLTGFTDLGETVDHEILHGIVTAVMGFLSTVVESFGGYVDKFEGDRLMALFGARSSAENDSARAVGCALRMMDALDELDPVMPSGHSMTARIGIHHGPVTVAPDPTGHVTATGSTVNLASRIEEMTESGRIWVSRSIREECGDLFSFRELGDFRIRGLSAPVSLYLPVGPGSLKQERWERASRLASSPLVDREEEREVLSELLSSARSGQGDTVLLRIRGDAGIGKSRLLHHLMGQAKDFLILHGHARQCSGTPFWIWIDLLRDYFGIIDGNQSDIAERIRDLARSCPDLKLGRKVLDETDRVAGLLSLTGQARPESQRTDGRDLPVAIRLVLDAIGTQGDIFLALEDAHWMDEPSWKLLELFIDTGAGPSNTFIAITERPDRSASLQDLDKWQLLELKPMGRTGISSISGYLLGEQQDGSAFSPELTALLDSGARGNPLYAEELILSLLDIGGLEAGIDRIWRLTADSERFEVPTTVRALFQSRVDMLTGIERKVLQIASVVGPEFRIPVLNHIMESLDLGESGESAVGSLMRKGFLMTGERGTIYFRHDLLQSSVYATVLRHNRKLVHGLAASAYEELYPEEVSLLAPMIFRHWERTGERDRTLQWALKALDCTRESEQNGEILKISETILNTVGEDPPEEEWQYRATALSARHNALARTGEIGEALEVIEELLAESCARGRVELEASALRSKSILLNETGDMEQVEELLRKALAKAEEAGDETLAGSIISSLANHYSDLGRYDSALEYYTRALAIFEEHGIARSLGSVKANMANLLMKIDRKAEAAEHYVRSVEIFRELGLRTSLGYSLNGLAITRAMNGDLEESRVLFEEAYDYQRDIGNKTLQAMILNNLGVLTRMLGDYGSSLQYRLQALEMARSAGTLRSVGIAQVNLGSIYRLLGDPEKALAYCAEALETARGARDSLTECHALSIAGMTHLHLGDVDRALASYREALGIMERNNVRPGVVEDFHDFMGMLKERGIPFRVPSGWDEETG